MHLPRQYKPWWHIFYIFRRDKNHFPRYNDNFVLKRKEMRPKNNQFTAQRVVPLILVVFLIYVLVGSSYRQQKQYQDQYQQITAQQDKLHVLVTGGAGFIGSHAAMMLMDEGHSVTVIDNLSRGNTGAIRVLQSMAHNGQFQFVEADLGNKQAVCKILERSGVDLVMHFAAVAYVGESMAEPLRYYHNITANTVTLLECMKANKIEKLVYSSTCATYGNVPKDQLPITEETPTVPINPYGKAKLMSETAIRDFAFANQDNFQAIIFRYFNVYGSDPKGRLGEYPPPELRHHGRISGACMDAALGFIDKLTVKGTQHPTKDGSCVRDYIHVTDLVSAHMVGMMHVDNPPNLYNVGTGQGVSVKEFVQTCKGVTKQPITIVEQAEARPGDYPEVYSNVTKIQEELGWVAKYKDVEVGLKHAWDWRKDHKMGY